MNKGRKTFKKFIEVLRNSTSSLIWPDLEKGGRQAETTLKMYLVIMLKGLNFRQLKSYDME